MSTKRCSNANRKTRKYCVLRWLGRVARKKGEPGALAATNAPPSREKTNHCCSAYDQIARWSSRRSSAVGRASWREWKKFRAR